MDENRVIDIVKAHVEGLFPQTCSNCGLVFDSFAEYLRNVTHLGDPISYDAELDDWRPMKPLGVVTYSNCRCGSTLAISIKTIDRLVLWRLMLWARMESWKRRTSMGELMRHIREKIDSRALSEGQDDG